ncbi:Sulfite exporter TauE/SafE family protein [Cryptosporidium felis]|nr:Sulfite exporter TauE/SafE family protein [Cryptosporidium felis]
MIYLNKYLPKVLVYSSIAFTFNINVSNAYDFHIQKEVIKSVLDLTSLDILSLIIVGCFVSIAVSAGGGGGIVSMPVFLSLMCLPFSQAVVFSTTMILGGVVCVLITNIVQYKRKSLEYSDAIVFLKRTLAEEQNQDLVCSIREIESVPLIDLQIVLFIAPLLTVGSLFGVAIGKFISSFISFLLLDLLLIYLLKVSISKFLSLRRSEKSRLGNDFSKDSELISSTYMRGLDNNKIDEYLKVILYLCSISVISFDDRNAISNTELDSKTIISSKTGLCSCYLNQNYKHWIFFFFLCLISILTSGIESGMLFNNSPINLYLWLTSIFILLLFPSITLPKHTLNLITSVINSQSRLTKCIKGDNQPLDYSSFDLPSFIQFKSSNNITNCLLAYIEMLSVGIIGGITGASGGILISAIFYSSQADSSSIAANNSTCLLISTFTCFITYLFEGRIYLDLAVLLLVISILCTSISKNVIDHYVRKYDLSSIIVFILISLISLSLIYMNLKLLFNLIK